MSTDADELLNAEFSRLELLQKLGVAGAAAGLGPLLLGVADRLGPADAYAALDEDAQDITVLSWAWPTKPNGLDPAQTADIQTRAILFNAFETLLQFDTAGRTHLKLATSWKQTSPTTYVYTIRRGVKFLDGSPLTVDDVVFSLNRMANPTTSTRSDSHFGAKYRQSGPDKVTATLPAPNEAFATNVATFDFAIQQKKAVLAGGPAFGTQAALPIGTGPFKVTEWFPDDHVTLKRNDHYWGASKPHVREVVFRPIVDVAARYLAMLSGQVDGTLFLPADQIPQWQKIKGTTVITAPDLLILDIHLNVQIPPLNDVHVRRAFAHCIDHPALVNGILRGEGQAALWFQPPSAFLGYAPSAAIRKAFAAVPSYSFDLAKAKNELKQSSVPNGFSITVQTRDSMPNEGKVFLSLAQNLQQIGVNMQVVTIPASQWFANLAAAKKPAISSIRWGPDTPDLGLLFDEAFNSANYRENAYNLSGYSGIDHLLAQFKTAKTNAHRFKLLMAMTTKINIDVPIIPIWRGNNAFALKKAYFLTKHLSYWLPSRAWMTSARRA
jgi:peptide/nickel transport system substrate-binding protein